MLDNKLESALDNWVTYAPVGVAYYSSLWLPPRTGASTIVYRSEDKGRTWKGPVEIPAKSFDQPKIVAAGKKADLHLYIAVTVNGKDFLVFRNPTDANGVAVLRSDDGGLSFKTTAFIAPDNLAHQAMNPLVLPDDSLLIPYVDHPFFPKHRNMNYSRIYVARSQDGGHTFGLPHFVADMPRAYPGAPHFAVDLSSSKFRGRIYAAWESGDFGPRRIPRGNGFVREESGKRRDVSISYSTDNGQTWSEARILRAENAGPAYFATLAVSHDGIVGVAWIQHEKYEINPHCYRTYFAASVDGGETFGPPSVVSDSVSCPEWTKNKESYFTAGRQRGGDYIGLAAAADGSFHPVWIDSRSGVFQVYTARIEMRK